MTAEALVIPYMTPFMTDRMTTPVTDTSHAITTHPQKPLGGRPIRAIILAHLYSKVRGYLYLLGIDRRSGVPRQPRTRDNLGTNKAMNTLCISDFPPLA
jgi:hypothetical protein